MSNYTKTKSVSIGKINISTESITLPTYPFRYVTKNDFPTTIANIVKDLLESFNENIAKQHASFHFDMNQMCDIYDQRSEAICTSSDQRSDRQH